MMDIDALEALAKECLAESNGESDWYNADSVFSLTNGYLKGDIDGAYIEMAKPAAILALIAEVRALREDAERYQWLKAHWGHRTPILNGLFPRGAVDDAFDAGIDAARKEKA